MEEDLLYLKKGTGKLCTIKENECVLCCNKDSIMFFNIPVFKSGYFRSEDERDEFTNILYEVLKDDFTIFKNNKLSDNDCKLLFDCIKTFILALSNIKKTKSVKDYIKLIKKELRELR